MPIGIVEFGMIGTIIVPGPPRFGSEHRMLGYGLRGQKPVLQFPRALKLVKVLRSEKVEIFL